MLFGLEVDLHQTRIGAGSQTIASEQPTIQELRDFGLHNGVTGELSAAYTGTYALFLEADLETASEDSG